MRIVYKTSLDIDSTTSEHTVTYAIPTLVPQSARLDTVNMREVTSQVVDYESLLGEGSLQATHCAVQISGLDNQTDAQLKVDIQGTIDGLNWTQISQQTGFVTTAAFAVNGYAMIRAKTTTAAASGTQAEVTFMLTRNP